jgi:Rps23 Pro-64 3,4-dihydroxylase Tpa1-like proline 4-hydroxylase
MNPAQIINPEVYDFGKLDAWHRAFRSATPYPHICFDNFLRPDFAESLYANFPKMSELRRHYNGLNEQKSEGSSFEKYHPHFQQLADTLRSAEFVAFVEQLTGIKGLSMPNDHRGAGVHQGQNGSFLDIHVDFSIHPTLQLHRRLNLLIYMNKDWKPEYGGDIELWDAEVKHLEKSYSPLFNRCVIFECSEISYHGYDKISVPEGQSRKSIFSYYYSAVGPDVRYHDTIFKARPTESTGKKVKTQVKEGMKNSVKRTMIALGLRRIFDKIE